MGWFIGRVSEEAFYPLLGVALLVGFVGAGLLTAARFLERANRDDSADIGSSFR